MELNVKKLTLLMTTLSFAVAVALVAAAQEKKPAPAPKPEAAAKAEPAKPAAAKKAEPAKKTDEAEAKDEKPKGGWSADTWSGLELRGIGPAVTSGRVVDIAVDPTDTKRWYLAVASGGVWKTENGGTTWTPVFDGEGSYSIGCVTIDPKNPNVVWVGTGENNSQRSVGYGDGVYKSEDGGKSWKNVGLKASEHIGKIVVNPKDSNVVYVAAQGPLWAPGGDRGLYKTTDGGKTWNAVLTIDENTGVTDVVMDPRDPDTLIAASYQRRRHVFTLIDGGPGSGVHKTTDGGKTWKKITSGLPKEEMGRIGLALAPTEPDTVYALVETAAANKAGGTFRSTNRGESWEKRGDYVPGGPMYYQEIFVDPKDAERLYSMDVFLKVSDDAGKTWRNLGERYKHVDNHAIWIDPDDTDHYLVGCDGGLYQSFDRAATWQFVGNLPVTQFYRVDVDNSSPVYYVYGGTQDNNTLGGPSRTLNAHGIANHDWFVTWGGDGFHARIDPTDPNIVYSTLQHGVLGRYDRRSGEAVLIQPQEKPGDDPLRWNWDSPLVLSPHKPTRLYFAAQRVFRSEDRGDSWTPISEDLTRKIDRNKLKVMGKVWGPDAVAKGASTSFYGNIVSLDESPLVEGLLYVGTDDGLVQVSEDGGKAWRRQETFPGVPEMSYVSDLFASRFDANVVYATFNNHKAGDFKPYVLRSGDRGRTWTSVTADLPARGSAWTIAEDTVEKELLFAGTEFGLFFSRDGGKKWVQLKGGMPVIAVRDLAIQKREGDLVIATFGRGFYVLDDLTPLRHATARRPRPGGTDVPGEARARLHPLDALRPQGEGVPRRDVLHRPEPALWRGLHLLPEGGGEDEAEGAARRREGGGEEGGGDRLPGRGRAPRRGARGGPGRRPHREGRRRQRRPPSHRPREGGRPPRGLGPALPGGGPDVAQARPHPRREPLLRRAHRPARRARDLHRVLREASGRRPHRVRRAADVPGRVARPADAEGGRREGAPGLRAEDRAAPACGPRGHRGGRGGAGAPQGREEGDRRHARAPTRSSARRRGASRGSSTRSSSASAATASWPAATSPRRCPPPSA